MNDSQLARFPDPQCDDGTYPDTHVRCNGCGAHWKINTLPGCHECDLSLQDMKDAGVYEEIESWRRHFQKHNAGYGFTSAAIAAPGALADGDRMNILREILAERHGDEGRKDE